MSERLTAKFPATTLSYSMLKICHLNDAFSDIFELEASQVGGQALPQNKQEKEKKKHQKKLKK